MALIELLPSSELETKESTVASSSFLTNTIRSILFSTTSSAIGSEIDNKLKQFTLQDVSDHDSDNDCWIIIYDRVYDVTKFLDLHPGGDGLIMDYAGRDCTMAFRGHPKAAVDALKEFEIGILPPHQRIYRFPGTIRISESKPE